MRRGMIFLGSEFSSYLRGLIEFFGGLSFHDTEGSEFFGGLTFRDTEGSEFLAV